MRLPSLPRTRFASTAWYPLPRNDAELVRFGFPSIASALDGDLWLCDEPTTYDLEGKIRDYHLVSGWAPIWQQPFLRPPSKLAVGGGASNGYFGGPNAAACDPTTDDFSVSILYRAPSSWVDPGGGWQIMSEKYGATGWSYLLDAASVLLYMGGGFTNVGPADYDGDYHLRTFSVDRSEATPGTAYHDGDAPVGFACPVASLTSGTTLQLGGSARGSYAYGGLIAWYACWVGAAIGNTGHNNMVTLLGL